MFLANGKEGRLMTLMCPHCGKTMESGELVFDFTDLCLENLLAFIKKETSGTEASKLDGACKWFFGQLLKDKRIRHSESEIFGFTRVNNNSNKNIHHRKYSFPIARIIEEGVKLREKCKENDRIDFFEWLDKNKSSIKNINIILELHKRDGGDIRADSIHQTKESDFGFINVTRNNGRRCCHCHKVVSYYAGRYPEIRLTVLGGPRVSKSTTFTACVAQFQNPNGSIFWEGSEEDEIWKKYKAKYLVPYLAGDPIQATQLQDEHIPKLTFLVRFNRNNPKYICLTFIDIPGELIGENLDDEIYERYSGCYENIDFVWYCTDPVELRQLINKEDIARVGYGESILSTEKICSNMRELAIYFKKIKCSIPVAYIIGKTDDEAITEEEKNKYCLYLDNETETHVNINSIIPLDVKKFNTRSRKTREYFCLYNPYLVDCFEEQFSERCYIAISAYGYNPLAPPENRTKQPYQCRLPFLWMLALKHHIDVQVEILDNRGKKIQRCSSKLNEMDETVKNDALHNLYSGTYKICYKGRRFFK